MSKFRTMIEEDIERTRATDAGTAMHLRLQRINIDAPRDDDIGIAEKIKSVPGLVDFFRAPARAEVPVIATLNGTIVSCRIDRMIIDDATQTVRILDFKTDVNRDANRAEYESQLKKYVTIMGMIYPNYKISSYILWTHDWTLEAL